MGIPKHAFWPVMRLVGILILLSTSIVHAATPDCGTTLTKNTKLDSDLICAETALRLTGKASKKITLNCDGHGIEVASGSGIFASNVTGVTIKGCVISTSDYFSHGIVLSGGSKNLIKDNTITTTGKSGRGIELRDSSSNTIKDNTVHTTNSGSNAIRLRSGSNENLLKDNALISDTSHVITIESSSKNKVYDNWLESPHGFLLQRNFHLQNGGLSIDDSGNIYAVENNWGSSDGIGTATAFFMVDPLTGLSNTVKPLLAGVNDIGFGFGSLDVLPNGRIFALPGFGTTATLYEIHPDGQVTSIALNLPGSVSGNLNGLEATGNTSLLATTNTGELLSIDLGTNTVTEIGSQGTGWTDLASHPSNGKTYAVSRRRDEGTNTAHLYEINVANGQIVTEIGDTGQVGLSSIDFAMDDTLYGNSDGELIEIDITDASVNTIGGFGPDPLEPFSRKTRLKGNWMQNANGSILFNDSITLPTRLLTNISAERVEILANQAMVDSAELPFLDEPARITLENLDGTYRNLLVDPEDDGSFVSCQPPQCKFVSFLNGSLIFDVNSFTTYSSEENADPTIEFVVVTTLAEIKQLLDESKLSKSTRKKLKAAREAMSTALKFLKKDQVKKGFTEISKTVKNLKNATGKVPAASTLSGFLVDASSEEAQNKIDEAIAVEGNPDLIREALDSIVEAQNQDGKGRPDKTINFYKAAWVSAQKAIDGPKCAETYSGKYLVQEDCRDKDGEGTITDYYLISGMVESETVFVKKPLPDGGYQSVAEIKTRYYPNGVLSSEEPYAAIELKNGRYQSVVVGVEKLYSESGSLIAEVPHFAKKRKDGSGRYQSVVEGIVKLYHENGVLKRKEPYVVKIMADGSYQSVVEGIEIRYNINGVLTWKTPYVAYKNYGSYDSLMEGFRNFYYETGELSIEEPYVVKRLADRSYQSVKEGNRRNFYKSGNVSNILPYKALLTKNGTGTYRSYLVGLEITYLESGAVNSERPYVAKLLANGRYQSVIEGTFKQNYQEPPALEGKRFLEIPYKAFLMPDGSYQSVRAGVEKQFHENGNVASETSYVQELQDDGNYQSVVSGFYISYLEDGRLYWDVPYTRTVIDGVKESRVNGVARSLYFDERHYFTATVVDDVRVGCVFSDATTHTHDPTDTTHDYCITIGTTSYTGPGHLDD